MAALATLVDIISACSFLEVRLSGVSCAYCRSDKPNLLICHSCRLVNYCDQECQKKHWFSHKHDCKKNRLASPLWMPAWVKQGRAPFFMRRIYSGAGANMDKDLHSQYPWSKSLYPWGNLPALDIGNLAHNEGVTYDKPLSFCFGASGDLRNMIETVIGLPDTYNGDCNIVLNDRDLEIVLRNVLILLIVMFESPEDAATVAMHLWYSSKLPDSIVGMIRVPLAEKVAKVCATIALDDKRNKIWTNEWKMDEFKIVMTLQKRDWFALHKLLEFDIEPNVVDEARAKLYNRMNVVDERDLMYLGCSPFRRVSCQRFVDTGILVPFDTDVTEFTVPNPTLVSSEGEWYDKLGVLPLAGWHISDVLASGRRAHIPSNDIYGALAFHVQYKIQDLHAALRKRPTCIKLLNVDIRHLSNVLPNEKFDRIDVSNLIDANGAGLGRLFHTCEKLLRSKAENVNACIISTSIDFTGLANDIQRIEGQSIEYPWAEMNRRTAATFNVTESDIRCLALHNPKARLYNHVSSYFLRLEDIMNLVLPNITSHFRDVDLEAKKKNTVVEQYPFRVPPEGPLSREKLDQMSLNRLTGQEAVIEWKRKNTPGEKLETPVKKSEDDKGH